MHKNKIGILISNKQYEKLKNGKNLSSLNIYRKTAADLALKAYFLCPKNGVGDRIRLMAYNDHKKNFEEVFDTVPQVIYNRSSLHNLGNRKLTLAFFEKGLQVYNSLSFKNGKDVIHQILLQEKSIAPYLPVTQKATQENILSMMNSFDKIMIKPVYSSIGKGIMLLFKNKNGSWLLEYKDEKQEKVKIEFNDKLPPFIVELIKNRKYIVQERIPLATYSGRPFDIRAIVQKNHNGEWQVSSLIAKLAPIGEYITNVGQGGEFDFLENYLDKNSARDEITKSISDLSLRIARTLEKHCLLIADLGLDIGITEEGKPYFIECNFRGQYHSLKKSSATYEVWRKIHQKPIEYGEYLLKSNGDS